MLPKTQLHVDLAQTNRDFAHALIQTPPIDRGPATWAIVAAFYSAVHYVNAYLWESGHIEPRNHSERSNSVSNDQYFRAVSARYKLLSRRAYDSRYIPSFTASLVDAQRAMSELAAIEIVALKNPLGIHS